MHGHDKADRTLIDLSIRDASEVLTIDPQSVLVLHALALACGVSFFLGMAEDRQGTLRETVSAAARAVELDGTNPRGYALRGFGAYLSLQLERYPDALSDARRAFDMNPNDTFVLEILAHLEVGAGEPEQAIGHAQQVLRLSPRQSRSHMIYNLLAYASHGAKQYAKGIEWASRALSDMPRMVQAQANLAVCLVGAGEIEKAKAVFSAGERLAPEYFRGRLEGSLPLARLEHRRRVQTFLRIAAGLEDPSAAEALR
jgi:adenylate cyclase